MSGSGILLGVAFAQKMHVPHFSQTLAAFAYGSRLLVYSRLSQATYTLDSPTPSLHSALQGVHGSYLHDRVDAPIAYYKGELVSKDGLRGFAQSLVGRANDILKGELLLDSRFDLFSQDIASLKDDMTIRANGHSFLTDARNVIALRPSQQMLLRRLLGAEGVGRHLYTLVDGGNICWHCDGIDGYLFHVEEFLAILAVLVNVTGGQPARGTELLTLRFANSATNLRNIYIQDSQVMIIADYYKNRGTPKILSKPRFLPPAVAQLMIVYLIRVIPFQVLTILFLCN